METLMAWAQRVVILSVLASFVEAVSPGVRMRKYVRLVLGFMIVAALIQPVLSIAMAPASLQQAIASPGFFGALDSAAPAGDDAVSREFRARLEPEVKSALLELPSVVSASVGVRVRRDETSGGWIVAEVSVVCGVAGPGETDSERVIRELLLERFGFDDSVLHLRIDRVN